MNTSTLSHQTNQSSQPHQPNVLFYTTESQKSHQDKLSKKLTPVSDFPSNGDIVPALTEGDEQTLCPVNQKLIDFLSAEINAQMSISPKLINVVVTRLAIEVTRICRKSDRIQVSGEVNAWQQSLAENRVKKYLDY